MLTLLALLATIGSGAQFREQPAPPAPRVASAPVRLWMNNDRRFRPGDRVRLQVDADVDGYLLVLNYDTDGRVRVLFPLDPQDDPRVQAGRRYEVRDNDSQAAFRASGDGTGLIFTAVAQEPWQFTDVVLAGRWDYTRLEIDRDSQNPETDLSNLVQSMAGPKGFDYDVLGYRVYGETTYSDNYSSYPGHPAYVYDDYLYCNNWSWRYDGCRRWPYDGGWAFGSGFYFGYSPHRYGYGYPSGYYPYGGGYYPYGGGYRPGNYGRGPTIVGRSREYNVIPRTPVGTGGFGRTLNGGRRNDGIPEIDWRSRARPVGGIPTRFPEGISRGGDRIHDVAPPARRVRPDGVDYPGGRSGNDRSNDRGRREPSYNAPRGNDGGGRSAPPPRSEPSHREAPPARSEPSHSSGGHSGGGEHSRPRGRP